MFFCIFVTLKSFIFLNNATTIRIICLKLNNFNLKTQLMKSYLIKNLLFSFILDFNQHSINTTKCYYL